MVFKGFKIASGTVQYRFLPLRQGTRHIPGNLVAAKLLKGTVAFQICFCHDINTVFITHIVPRNLVWIVAGADGIDIVAEHALHILLHFRLCDAAAAVCTPLVAVHTVNYQPLAVEFDDLIHNFNPAEADFIRNSFQQGSVFIFQLNQCFI